MFALYGLYNDWNPLTLLWGILEEALVVYSLFLTVASVKIQPFLLLFQHYLKGIAQILLIKDLFIWFFTLYQWMSTIDYETKLRSPTGDTAATL